MKSMRKDDLVHAHHESTNVRMRIMSMGNFGCRALTLQRRQVENQLRSVS
jgi:hypothetical protein